LSIIQQLCEIYNCRDKEELFDYIIYLENQGEVYHSLELVKDMVKRDKQKFILYYLEEKNVNLEFLKGLIKII